MAESKKSSKRKKVDTPIEPTRHITYRQRQILDFIERYARDRGFPPTVREIQRAVGLQSTSSVHAQLKNLEEAGFIKRERFRPRAMGLTAARGAPNTAPTPQHDASTDRTPDSVKDKVLSVPLMGRIAAGSPAPPYELHEDTVGVPLGVFSALTSEDLEGGRIFFLRVSGDSMVGAGINEGDLVLVRRQPTARSGEIVVAVVDGETTVKRLRIAKSAIVLEPENPFYSPIKANPEEIQLVGKVIGLIRPQVS